MAEVDEDSLIYQDFDKSNQTYTIKLLMIGDQCVGKSSLQLCFSGDAFNASFLHTVGIEFRIRTIELDGKKIKLQIWNIVGQERFRTVTAAYYRGTKGCMLVYDITNERSFNNIRNWMREMEEYAPRDVEKMILGNKCDKCDRRQVSKERGEKLAIEHGFKFMETSGKYNINVEDAFYTLARDIKAKMDRQIDASSLPKGGNERKLTAQDQPKKCTIL